MSGAGIRHVGIVPRVSMQPPVFDDAFWHRVLGDIHAGHLDPDAPAVARSPALHLAVRLGQHDMVAACIRAGCGVGVVDHHGHTPLGIAVGARLPQGEDLRTAMVIGALLRAGADPDAIGPAGGGRPALGAVVDAAMRGFLPGDGITPDVAACRRRGGIVACVHVLIAAGASPVGERDLTEEALLDPDGIIGGDPVAERRDIALRALTATMPATHAWRWAVSDARIRRRPIPICAPVSAGSAFGRLVDAVRGRRTVHPSRADLTWAMGWAAAHPMDPDAMGVLAACGQAAGDEDGRS